MFGSAKDPESLNEGFRHYELREQAAIHRATWHQRHAFKLRRKLERRARADKRKNPGDG